jgi:hypothetical protein
LKDSADGYGADSGYAEVAGGGGVTPRVCPERADTDKKSLEMAMYSRKPG